MTQQHQSESQHNFLSTTVSLEAATYFLKLCCELENHDPNKVIELLLLTLKERGFSFEGTPDYKASPLFQVNGLTPDQLN
uniref:Uncharacterized protein n=1 Tax=Tolypothrix bouteillei VB521301 TaxID=1479485 RepID=A0A0C1QZ03_9CYAN